VEVLTAPVSTPNPAWLSFVRTGRARSKIRHHLKTLAQTESEKLGEKLLHQALRAEGIASFPDEEKIAAAVWEKLLRFTGNKNRSDLLTDIGLGKRVAAIVAKRLVHLLSASGGKLDTLLLSHEHFSAQESHAHSALVIDGTENASVHFASCCRPIPGDAILAYLGRGEGLEIHADDCPLARKRRNKDSERFIPVEWADEPVRTFEVGLLVTVTNGKGVLAQVASALTTAEADICHLDMGKEAAQETIDLRFVIAVRDRVHLAKVLRNLKRTAPVLRAERVKSGG
jgi:guanosine-3',5'-bis(diphosphate) 3'-pyrophosphohydrolase